jgi:nucleoside-diphosphate-sugar epimerase
LTQCIQKWDFLYIDDAVQGILRLMENDCVDGAYNFGSGKSEDLKVYIEEMHKITNSKSVLNYGAITYPPTGMVSILPIVEKFTRTGWHPKTSFSEGISHIIESINVDNTIDSPIVSGP